MVHSFAAVARLPAVDDNVAIATRRLEAGERVSLGGRELRLDATVLEGHRFAVKGIAAGSELLSWGLPFGVASRDIEPGSYVCNDGMLTALRGRSVAAELPAEANFRNAILPFRLDEAAFEPARQVPRSGEERTFPGFVRPGGRGVGTRNAIVLLGTTSLAGSYVRRLAERLNGAAGAFERIDGVVPVAHTEGGTGGPPNNLELVLRALSGFIVHPNAGAVLVVDQGTEAVSNRRLEAFMRERAYPLDHVPHAFLSLTGPFEEDLDRGEGIVRAWLEPVGRAERSRVPLSALKVALQCGGSDAFSGVSGNPLAAWAVRELLRHGGSANLAETDELIGAEAYLLQRVRDLPTARRFLATVERFKAYAAWHGASAEGNPSGGNKLRGLYNIVLKSLGAAMKKHPEVSLDHVIDYGEPMREPGFTFMDSPGNDLESIAGQVASGANLIYFITGNGSITNFPFVPTLKIVTTSERYRQLAADMDVNAGAYLDGTPLEELGFQLFERTVRVAAGERTVGERAGHAQVQLWRNWAQKDGRNLAELLARSAPGGEPLPIGVADDDPTGPLVRTREPHLGLILPTSLCAGQIARLAAERLNAKELGRSAGISRFVALMHTEGCGMSSGPVEALLSRTLVGYLLHPSVRLALLLEHGCETLHNDAMRARLRELGLAPERFGWASIQGDGGIEAVLARIEDWFAASAGPPLEAPADPLRPVPARVGLLAAGAPGPEAARCLAGLARRLVGTGGTVVVPASGGLIGDAVFARELLVRHLPAPTLAYGQRPERPGFHLMEVPGDHWVETLTGLGATGVEVMLAHVADRPRQGHPLVPLLQVATGAAGTRAFEADLDLVLTGPAESWQAELLRLLQATLAGRLAPKAVRQGNTDFQLTRGLLGISL